MKNFQDDVGKLRTIISSSSSSSSQAMWFHNCVVVSFFCASFFRQAVVELQDDAQLRHTSGNLGSDLADLWRRWIVSEAESGCQSMEQRSRVRGSIHLALCVQSHRSNPSQSPSRAVTADKQGRLVLDKIVETFVIIPWVNSYYASSVFVTPLILSSRQFLDRNI